MTKKPTIEVLKKAPLKEIRAIVEARYYDAGSIFEQLERAARITKGGHVVSRSIAAFAVKELETLFDQPLRRGSSLDRRCTGCGAEMLRDVRPMAYTYKGQERTINVPCWYCKKCEHKEFTTQDLDAIEKAKADLARLLDGQ